MLQAGQSLSGILKDNKEMFIGRGSRFVGASQQPLTHGRLGILPTPGIQPV